MDGYDVAREIRSQPGGWDVRLIALTGYGFPEDRERSRAAGFDRHLVKPAMPEDLRRELDYADVPLKQAVISPSALSLMYPAEEIPGYTREQFLEDLLARA